MLICACSRARALRNSPLDEGDRKEEEQKIVQDRPTKTELLSGVEYFLTDVAIAELTGPAKFHARVAAHTVRMVLREIESEEDDLRLEVAGLRDLFKIDAPPLSSLKDLREEALRLNEKLSEEIRQGKVDSGPFRERAIRHLRDVAVRKLEVSNPKMSELAREELKPD